MKLATLTAAALAGTLAFASAAQADPRDHHRGHGRHWEHRDRGHHGHRPPPPHIRHYGPPPHVRHYAPPPPRYYGPGPRWSRGDHLPYAYRGPRYIVHDWRGRRLAPPPRGYQWVNTGGAEYLLVGIATGVILQSVLSR